LLLGEAHGARCPQGWAVATAAAGSSPATLACAWPWAVCCLEQQQAACRPVPQVAAAACSSAGWAAEPAAAQARSEAQQASDSRSTTTATQTRCSIVCTSWSRNKGVPHRRRRCSAYLVDQQGRRRPRRSERAAGDGEADREQMEATARRRRCSSASLPPPRCSPQTPVPRRDPFRRPRRAAAAFVVAARRGLPPNRKTKWPWFAETRKYALGQELRSLAAV